MDGYLGKSTSETARQQAKQPTFRHRLWPYFGAIAVTALALLLALLIKTYLFVANVTLVFLGGVVLCALRWGWQPALLTCVLSVLALNFFVFPPLHDLRVEDPENIVTVVIFVAVAILVGRLTAQAHANARLAEDRARVMRNLYAFARELTNIDDLDQLLQVTTDQIASSIDVETILLLPEQEDAVIRAAVPPVDDLDPVNLALIQQYFNETPGARPESEGLSSSYLLLPLRAGGTTVAVVALCRNGRPPILTAIERRFVEAITDQVALAIKRLTLAADCERARVSAETESLRSAMLSAISHDLKTPLASILGAATSLGTYNSYFEQQERDELVATIREEAERMSRFVANLLDITRVESGTLEVQNEATDLEEVVGSAVRRARRFLGNRQIVMRVAPNLPMLYLDGVLLEQTIFNILDNAAKYSPKKSAILVDIRRVNDRIVIKLIDEGPGIKPHDLQRIFEKFYRSGHSGRQRAGTGLGLAICRGFVEAMGGRIIAGNRTDRSGAVFMIGFPVRGSHLPLLPVLDDD